MMSEPQILEMSERFRPERTALVLIDLQKDFCLEGYGTHRAGRDVTAAQRAARGAARLLETARTAGMAIAHVAFWTLPDHGSDSGPWLAQRRRSTFSSESLCLADSDGAAFIDEVAPRPGELVVRKHRYSAFTGTNLDVLLRARRIQSVVLCGVSTNACVESTARAAFELDYYVCVPPDATGSWDRTLHDATLANVNHRLGVTLGADELVALWGAGRPLGTS
ncbi:MAG: isochorismatase family cysteine hydrolase [Phenylobacterium sp.]|nr:isochorismatase family cysteine hydrolase [Phenylobacterium sp.]